MKLLHTSDWHLGANDVDRSLYEDQKFFIDEICDVITTENVDAVIIAGDVYDKSVTSAEAVRLYDYAMNRMCLELEKEVFIIAGNHDSSDRLAGCKNLLKKTGLHVLGSLEREPHIISCEDTDIYLMPWFTEEKVKGLFPERSGDIKCLTDAYRVACESARQSFNPKKRHIAVAHAFITNASVSESDKSAKIAAIGTALQVDADVFDDFDYVALGHIHGPQNISDTVRYCGTPMAYSFGKEEKQEKSVTIIDTETMEKKIVPLHPLHKRTTIEGTFEDILKADCEDDVRNGYVKLCVTDQYVGLEGMSKLRAIYPLCLGIQGKSFEGDGAEITMTMQEFEELEDDPVAIFKNYCLDVMKDEPSAHMLDLFNECLESEE